MSDWNSPNWFDDQEKAEVDDFFKADPKHTGEWVGGGGGGDDRGCFSITMIACFALATLLVTRKKE